MQFDKSFTSHFVDPSTGLPITGLTGVTIVIKKKISAYSWEKVVDNASCTDIGDGWYNYEYEGIGDFFYVYTIYPNDSRVQPESGLSDRRWNNLDGAITDIRAGGGGASINIQGIQTTIRNSRDSIVEELNKKHQETLGKFNETNSQIDIAKEEITDKIESIEIPETDLSSVNASLGVVKTQLTKAISGKDKEKAELAREYEKKLKDKDKEIKDLEETYKELEKSTDEQINEKVSEKQQLIDELEETAQELMEEMEDENANAKELVIEKIKQSL